MLKQPPALLACQPISEPNPNQPYSFHAADARRQFRTQESGVSGFISDTTDRRESQVDGRGCIVALLKVDPIAEDDRAVECQPRLRTVPGDELANGMVVGSLAAGGCEAVQDSRFGVFEIGEG